MDWYWVLGLEMGFGSMIWSGRHMIFLVVLYGWRIGQLISCKLYLPHDVFFFLLRNIAYTQHPFVTQKILHTHFTHSSLGRDAHQFPSELSAQHSNAHRLSFIPFGITQIKSSLPSSQKEEASTVSKRHKYHTAPSTGP